MTPSLFVSASDRYSSTSASFCSVNTAELPKERKPVKNERNADPVGKNSVNSEGKVALKRRKLCLALKPSVVKKKDGFKHQFQAEDFFFESKSSINEGKHEQT